MVLERIHQDRFFVSIPTVNMAISKRKITADEGQVTSAAHLALRQSILPCLLVTILFFLWGFAYGLLDFLTPISKLSLISPPLRRPGRWPPNSEPSFAHDNPEMDSPPFR